MPQSSQQFRTKIHDTSVRPPHVWQKEAPTHPGKSTHTPWMRSTESDEKPLSFAERMLRNTAFCIAALLCVLALQQTDAPAAIRVSDELREWVTMDVNESLGSLQFVKNILPKSAMVFWNIGSDRTCYVAPVSSTIQHAWCEQEPWVAYDCTDATDVYVAAAGEVMSLSYQDDQTIMMRIRHENGMETLYGNLGTAVFREGDWVESSAKLGTVAQNGTLLFEMREEGKSLNPAPLLQRKP
ncbi:MAG: M23 family metallopeptidase [Clostridia bacterium]